MCPVVKLRYNFIFLYDGRKHINLHGKSIKIQVEPKKLEEVANCLPKPASDKGYHKDQVKGGRNI